MCNLYVLLAILVVTEEASQSCKWCQIHFCTLKCTDVKVFIYKKLPMKYKCDVNGMQCCAHVERSERNKHTNIIMNVLSVYRVCYREPPVHWRAERSGAVRRTKDDVGGRRKHHKYKKKTTSQRRLIEEVKAHIAIGRYAETNAPWQYPADGSSSRQVVEGEHARTAAGLCGQTVWLYCIGRHNVCG